MFSRDFRSGLAVALIATAIAGCGGGGGGDNTAVSSGDATGGSSTNAPQTISDKGIVSGKVVDQSGAPVASVGLQVDGATVTTNEQGFFVIESVAPAERKVVRSSKSGYMPGSHVVTVVAGQNAFVNLSINKVGVTRTNISSATASVITDARSDGVNGSVTIPANAVVDASGRPVNSYTAELTTLVPSDPRFAELFPGRFLGGSQAGSTANPQPLVSYGVVNVDLKDAQGNALQLAPGAKATLNFPIVSGHDPGTPTVPLWYVDKNSGIWIREGTATRSGNSFVGQVDHFTPWNCDQQINGPSYKRVLVRGLNYAPVDNAIVRVRGNGYEQVANTGPDGIAFVPTAPLETVVVSAERGGVRAELPPETMPATGGTVNNTIDLVPPLVTIILTWGQRPADLDAHLTGPGGLHIWYRNKGDALTTPYAKLDTDDRDSTGPEIITITNLSPGTYRYSVHNYSTQAAGTIEASTAVVNLNVAKTGAIRRYDVPTQNPLGMNGSVWVVFEINVDSAGNPTIVDVSQFKAGDASGLPVMQ